MPIKKLAKQRIKLVVYQDSGPGGREPLEFSDCKELRRGLAKLVNSAIRATQRDGIGRQVGIAVVPTDSPGYDNWQYEE